MEMDEARSFGGRAAGLSRLPHEAAGRVRVWHLAGVLQPSEGKSRLSLDDASGHMFVHAGQGYAGHGTLCGALGVSSYVINMACYDDKQSYAAIIDRMMYWYSEMKFPTERFDDISPIPKQIQAQAMTPLCHTSVSKWTLGRRSRSHLQGQSTSAAPKWQGRSSTPSCTT